MNMKGSMAPPKVCAGCNSGSLAKPANRTPGKVISKNRPMAQHSHRTFTLGGRGSGSGIR